MGILGLQTPTLTETMKYSCNIKSGSIGVKRVWEVWEGREVWEDLVMLEDGIFFSTEVSGFDISRARAKGLT